VQIIEIDPNKKYVIALPEASKKFALQIHEVLKKLREGDAPFLVIFGTDVTVIPADQVVGYIMLENGQ